MRELIYSLPEGTKIKYQNKRYVITATKQLYQESSSNNLPIEHTYIRPGGYGPNLSNEGVFINSAALVEVFNKNKKTRC